MSNWALLACKLGCGKSNTDLASASLMFGPQPSLLAQEQTLLRHLKHDAREVHGLSVECDQLTGVSDVVHARDKCPLAAFHVQEDPRSTHRSQSED